jgi:glycerol-3-phosphate acyltransferase PlsY
VTATSLAVVVAAYLIGSIPSGYLLVRSARRIDLRDYGSQGIGAINACSVAGPGIGMATLLLDTGKALVVVLLAAPLARSPWVIAAAAFAVMAGHAYSFWLFLRERRFSDGKCVACALGALVGLAYIGALPWQTPAAVVGVWLAGLLGPRAIRGRWSPISPATMAAAAALPVIVYIARPVGAYFALAVATAALILVRHKGNVRRLLAGTEPPLDRRLSRRASAEGNGPSAAPRRDSSRRGALSALQVVRVRDGGEMR